MTTGVVIPLSGGMDSALLLYESLKQGYDTHPIILDDTYGKAGVRDKGMIPAMNLVREAGLHHRLTIIPFFPTSVHKVADGKYGYTPGRNMAIALAALAYADFVKASAVWLGFNASQEAFYPDQTQEMFDVQADLYNKIYGTNISIALPLTHMNRTDVVRRGSILKIPFHLTVSCVTSPVPVNCGVCKRCKERRHAFQSAGVSDQTLYLKEP